MKDKADHSYEICKILSHKLFPTRVALPPTLPLGRRYLPRCLLRIFSQCTALALLCTLPSLLKYKILLCLPLLPHHTAAPFHSQTAGTGPCMLTESLSYMNVLTLLVFLDQPARLENGTNATHTALRVVLFQLQRTACSRHHSQQHKPLHKHSPHSITRSPYCSWPKPFPKNSQVIRSKSLNLQFSSAPITP